MVDFEAEGFAKNKTIRVKSFISFGIGMKLYGRSTMSMSHTRSRSRRTSILLAVAVLMIVVVGSSSENINEIDNVTNIDTNENQTQYHPDIQMNLIDSELNEDGNDIQEIHQTEPNTILTNKVNATVLSESTSEIEESQEHGNETNLNDAIDAIPFETTTVPILDETVSTLIPINENTSLIATTHSTGVTTPQTETQTQSYEFHQAATPHPHNTDLSIYFENEPSRARQLRGSMKEIEDEVVVQSDPGSESNSSSKSSESGIASLSDSSSDSDENKAAEDLSLSGNSSNEVINVEPQAESTPSIAVDPVKSLQQEVVDEIEAVTESTGELTNDVTVVSNMETHTIMKKPGVDDESLDHSSIPEKSTEIGLTKSITELDPVVSMVLNSPREILESSSTLIPMTENQSSDSKELKPNKITEESEDAPLEVSENKISEKAEVLVNAEIVGKSKEIAEDSNSVDLNIETPSNNLGNKLGDHTSLPELQKSFKPQPENSSSPRSIELNSSLNVISNTEINDDKSVEANILINNIETSTHSPSVEISETSLLEIKPDQSNNKENGIFKEDLFSFTTETSFADIEMPTTTEITTGKFDEGPEQTALENNHIVIVTDNITSADSFQTNDNLAAISNDNTSSGLNKKSFSELNSILPTEGSFSEEQIESSTQSPPYNRYDSEVFEEVQEDQTSKADNGVSKETGGDRQNPSDDSLPDPKLYAQAAETSTEMSNVHKNHYPSTTSLDKNQAGTTSDYARHVDSLQTMRDETSSVVSTEVVAPASIGRSLNEIVAEGLGKPLPTRSVGDEPSSSSYSSEDKTTTVLVLCAAAGGIFIAFSFAIYLISFQRQHGTLDIEMQEQRCGKDNLDDDDDSETRVSLLNQIPTVDSDEHSSD